MLNRLRDFFTRVRTRSQVEVGAPEDISDDQERVFGLHASRIPSGGQWRLIPSFFSSSEHRAVRWLTTLASISGIVLVVALLTQHLGFGPRPGGTLTIGLAGTPQFINPVLARPQTVDADLTRLLFRGLTQTSETFEPALDLAESITPSADRKTYTVVLRPNLHWSDGEPLTADDVKFTVDTIKDQEYGSPLRPLFQTATVEIVDDRTLTFTIQKPLAAFPYYFDIGILPRHAWFDATPQNMPLAELNVKPVTNGPYKFHSVTKDRNGSIKSIAFIRDKLYAGHPPYIQKLVYKFYVERPLAVDALETGAIDLLGGITGEENQQLSDKFKRSQLTISQLTAVFFNQRQNPVFRSKEIRQALAMTVDRDDIIRTILPDMAEPVYGPVLPGYPGHMADVAVPKFDRDAANRLLDEQGWKKNDKGIRQKGSQLFVFALTVPDDPTYVATAEHLIKIWSELGAGIEIKRMDVNRIQRDAIRPREYESLLFGQIHDADGDLYPFWHSSQQRDPGFNLSMYFNKKVDQALEAARSAASPEDRIKNYQDFQRTLTEDVPAIFLYQHHFLIAHQPSVRGIESERLVSPSDRYQRIDSWYVRRWITWE